MCKESKTEMPSDSASSDPQKTAPFEPLDQTESLRHLGDTISTSDTPAPQLPTSDRAHLPEQFGRYQIVGLLGEGGMGAVYLAEDPKLERRVAIKVPFLDRNKDNSVIERFYREAKAIAALEHPNICPIHEIAEFDGVHYMAMAFIDGRLLSEFVKGDKSLSTRHAVMFVRKIALALQQAHEVGVIHRDLKPSNIMMRKVQNRLEPVIMDFGLARREGAADEQLTQSGQIMGTPNYMPPEQVTGNLEAMGPACDIYSLGVILYRLISGHLPLKGTDVLATLSNIANQEPDPPSKHRPDIDERLDAICLKAMSKRIEDRYSSMEGFATALTKYLKGEDILDPEEQKELAELSAKVATPHPTVESKKPFSDAKVLLMSGIVLSLAAMIAIAWLYLAAVIFQVETPAGTLIVEVNEPDAQVQVLDQNKKVIITRKSGKEVITLTVDPGKHTLIVDKEGYDQNTREFTIKEGGTERIAVRLKPRQEWQFEVVEGGLSLLPSLAKNGIVRYDKKVHGVAVTPDGLHYVACVGHDLIIQKIDSGEELGRCLGHQGTIWQLAISPDGQRLLSGSSDKSARMWDLKTQSLIREFNGHTDHVKAVAFSPDGRYAASGSLDNTVRIWDLESGEEIQRFNGHQRAVLSVQFTPDGRSVISGASQEGARLWKVSTGHEIHHFPMVSSSITGIAFLSDGKRFVAGTNMIRILIGNINTREEVRLGAGRRIVAGWDIALSRNERFVLSGGGGNANYKLVLWDIEADKEVLSFEGHTDEVWGLAFTPDERSFISGSKDGTVRLWKLPPIVRSGRSPNEKPDEDGAGSIERRSKE